jgi:acetyl esterase
MALHPVIASNLANAVGKTPYHALPIEQARAQLKSGYQPKSEPVAVGRVQEVRVPRIDGSLPVRVYSPLAQSRVDAPLLVFFHGSGFVALDLDTHDDICRRLCAGAGCVVASVDYRLAPEHPFPAAPDDCLAATRWLAEHAGQWGASSKAGLALAGDSAGACLAAVTAWRLRTQGRPVPTALLMWYPVTDHPSAGWPSYRECAQGYGLSAEGMAWFWAHYLPSEQDASHPHAAPLRAPDLAGMPSTWLMTAQYDVLRDEGEQFAQRLKQAGVPVICQRSPGMNHGFLKYIGVIDAATDAMDQACAWLKTTWAKQAEPDPYRHSRAIGATFVEQQQTVISKQVIGPMRPIPGVQQQRPKPEETK